MLALYHFGPVANSLTPLLCLLEKGLEFANHRLDSRRWEHHAPEFRALSPEGMVPVLVHDGRVLTESSVINEYLDDLFPEMPLRPADPFERAQMRIWVKYVDEYFCPALTVLGAHSAARFAAQMDQAELARRIAAMPNAEVRQKWQHVAAGGFSDEALAEAKGKLARVAERLEAHLADRRTWLLGEDYSLADIKWYSMVPGLPRLTPELCGEVATPNIMAWLARMGERAAVRQLADYAPPAAG
jgi:glutathione S-transferase